MKGGVSPEDRKRHIGFYQNGQDFLHLADILGKIKVPPGILFDDIVLIDNPISLEDINYISSIALLVIL